MRALALMILLLVCSPAKADSWARTGDDWVRVTAKPCTDEKVLAHIQAAGHNPQDYRAASAYFVGQAFHACWRPMFEQQRALVWYEDGDQGLVPFRDLKPVPEA